MFKGRGLVVTALLIASLASLRPVLGEGIREVSVEPRFEHGQGEERETKEIAVRNEAFQLKVNNWTALKLSKRYFIHTVSMAVQSNNAGHASVELRVNGQRVGKAFAPRSEDPVYEFRVERNASSIELRGLPTEGPEGTIQVSLVSAVVSETDPIDVTVTGESTLPVVACNACSRRGIKFPTFYRDSVLANVAHQAIFLVNQLMDYSNYRQLGDYLLPIKKTAAKARAIGQNYDDLGDTAKFWADNLMTDLDNAEAYLDDMFERGKVFDLATDLLGLREFLRRTRI